MKKRNLEFKILFVAIIFFGVFGLAESSEAADDFRVVGYFVGKSGEENLQFDYLTHVNVAFLYPQTDGTFIFYKNNLDNLVQLAHARGVKVFISVGGWMGGDDSAFHAVAANATLRAAFVSNLDNFVTTHNLDGADIDWEFPEFTTTPNDFTRLMSELATRLHSKGKLLTAAVHGNNYASAFSTATFQEVDFLNLMAYDHGTPHSPYSYAVTSLDYWLGRGLLASKAVLGVPFYGRTPETFYKDIVVMDPQAPYKDQVGTIYYNGIATIKQKTQLALDRASGIMIWELSQDTPGNTSLLRAINEVVPASDTTAPAAPQGLNVN